MANKLRRARRLVERGWCQHAFAKNKHGRGVPVKSRYAVAWCTDGACMRAGADSLALVMRGRHSVSQWNDDPRRTKKQVLAAFDRAIALAERESAQ